MVKMEEEKPLANKEERKEKEENSLLNYEYDEDDDGDVGDCVGKFVNGEWKKKWGTFKRKR